MMMLVLFKYGNSAINLFKSHSLAKPHSDLSVWTVPLCGLVPDPTRFQTIEEKKEKPHHAAFVVNDSVIIDKRWFRLQN